MAITASKVANKLLEMGFKNITPWVSKGYFGIQRIYYGSGYIEISGKFGFRAVNIDYAPKLVEACKQVVDELRDEEAARYKDIETCDLFKIGA